MRLNEPVRPLLGRILGGEAGTTFHVVDPCHSPHPWPPPSAPFELVKIRRHSLSSRLELINRKASFRRWKMFMGRYASLTYAVCTLPASAYCNNNA